MLGFSQLVQARLHLRSLSIDNVSWSGRSGDSAVMWLGLSRPIVYDIFTICSITFPIEE